MRDFQSPGRSMVYARNGMCATSHPLAAQAAVSLMQSGGNAVDAAIGAAVLLGFCEPPMCGLGGDLFALVKPAGSERLVALNGSGRAPAGLDPEALRAGGATAMPEGAPDAVTVPGAVDAFARLSADWGRLGLAASLGPAIRYAEEGVAVAPRTAADWADAASTLKGAARGHFLRDGRALRAGETFRAPAQAALLRRIAAEGRSAFYEGEAAEDMVGALRALGGAHTLEDFATASCDYVEPISGPYRGWELVEIPPNGQGATAILLARILACLDLAGLDPLGAARAHLEAEAVKLAYDARDRFVGDPTRAPLRLDHMLSDATAAALADLIAPDRALPDPPAATEALHRDTVYLTVVDADRMAVSMIYSIFSAFGSGIASPKFGVLFHDRGAGFNLIPGHVNEAGGGKRPLHTIIPAMLRRDGRLAMPFGVMGGAYQPAGHMRLISNLVDFAMDPQAAIDAPRSFARNGVLELETGYAAAVAEDLERRGHRVVRRATPLGGAQAIVIDAEDGVLIGASDPRKDGCAIGY